MLGFHVHKWKTVSSQRMSAGNEVRHYTLFSERCKCGEWRIVREEGHWLLQNGIPVAD